jgi:DNA-binding transcriptional regulator GbsR (MarR family)
LTEITEGITWRPWNLSETGRRFVIHWGEMGSAWGVNRTVARSTRCCSSTASRCNAEEISDTLAAARSNVSTSLKELTNWKLVRATHVLGDRRDYFETSHDVWELFRTIVRERKEREFDPRQAAARAVSQPGFEAEPPDVQDRLRETLRFMEGLGVWSEKCCA